MKVAIIGSRSFTDWKYFEKAITAFRKKHTLSAIISGNAQGADTLAKRYAQQHQIQYIEFKANWNDLTAEPVKVKTNQYGKQYNALAGFNRNLEMASECECAIAFWDNNSKGTEHMINELIKLNKKCYIINV